MTHEMEATICHHLGNSGQFFLATNPWWPSSLTGQAANLSSSLSASGPRVQQHLALLQGALDAVAGEPPKEAGCTGRIDHFGPKLA